MEPLTLITTFVSALISSILVGTICKKSVERYIDKKNKDRDELAKYRSEKNKNELQDDMKEIIKAELKPLNSKVDELSQDVRYGIEGTVTLLRETMKQTRDQFTAQGYASSSDVASWRELYKTYKKLGGNHFSEYVDSWAQDVEKLPREPEKKEN